MLNVQSLSQKKTSYPLYFIFCQEIFENGTMAEQQRWDNDTRHVWIRKRIRHYILLFIFTRMWPIILVTFHFYCPHWHHLTRCHCQSGSIKLSMILLGNGVEIKNGRHNGSFVIVIFIKRCPLATKVELLTTK